MFIEGYFKPRLESCNLSSSMDDVYAGNKETASIEALTDSPAKIHILSWITSNLNVSCCVVCNLDCKL